LGVDDKGTTRQSPDFKDPDDANPVTDTMTIERPDNGDRRRQPDDDARVIPIPEVDLDSVIDIRQNDDSDSTTGVERSGGDAELRLRAGSTRMTQSGSGMATTLELGQRSWSTRTAGRAPDGLMMSPGLGSRIQSAQATWWALVNWRQASGLVRSGRMTMAWAPRASRDMARDRYLPVLENWVTLESAMDREVTHAISTTE